MHPDWRNNECTMVLDSHNAVMSQPLTTDAPGPQPAPLRPCTIEPSAEFSL